MTHEMPTSQPNSQPSFALGVEIGRIRGQLDLLLQGLIVLLQRCSTTSTPSASPPASTATGTTGPTTTASLLRKLLHKLSGEAVMEASRWVAHKLGAFLLRKVLPSALAAAFATVSGLGSQIASWLGLLWRMVGW